MKVLVINGDCVQINSSANLCHLSYIRGMIDSGMDVTLLSAGGKGYETDSLMQIPQQVTQHTFNGISLYQKLSSMKKQVASRPPSTCDSNAICSENVAHSTIRKIKSHILSLYGVHGIYATFVKHAKRFESTDVFDYVLSLSTPPSSHLLAYKLLISKQIIASHWIQIWEDP